VAISRGNGGHTFGDKLSDGWLRHILQNGADETRAMTYAALDLEVRSLAAHLQAAGLSGERVLLLYPSGPEYLIAVLASLYAGAVAVPLCAPQANRSIARVETVALNCQPRAALTCG
jgi:acyl-CoA synthetase (AMP-forming)/AMP-acid ligase II